MSIVMSEDSDRKAKAIKVADNFVAMGPELLETLAECVGALAGCVEILRQIGHDKTAAMVQEKQAAGMLMLAKAVGLTQ